jgi:hypothetical protein
MGLLDDLKKAAQEVTSGLTEVTDQLGATAQAVTGH